MLRGTSLAVQGRGWGGGGVEQVDMSSNNSTQPFLHLSFNESN